MKLNSQLLNIAWERIILTKDENQASINLILREEEKIIIGRYIQNEKYVKDFLTKIPKSEQLKEEILLFVYFAGHGCGNTKRIFVLNELQMSKIFWDAESNLL